MDSLRAANLRFLSSGRMKAQRWESTRKPRNLTMRLGNREDLVRPMKYPREIRTAAAINAAASANSKSDQVVVDFADFLHVVNCPTCQSSIY